ncbi:hypothetical protein OsI_05957 [Oryza sativa Indica Group]|uniref:CRIB domain-containing protein n=2 Tax=Oryza TaxID=4527 RepID=B8AI69_ORYSI|nr:CRIB domain-containing protein RIC10-like [Oryza glaberrima]EEC72543.1 hypothetical protein OsI_05957 [Oryza sativa Indica Group]
MAIKMKGIFKGLKIISQMFVHKEHEMEIGYPTDVKHVAHIGLGTSDTSPSWMNEFTGTEDLSTGSLSTTTAPSRQTSWASLDFEQPRSMLPIEILPEKSGQEAPSCPDIPRGPRKVRRKKTRTSSPTSSARSSSSRSRTSFATAYDAFNESQRGFRVA